MRNNRDIQISRDDLILAGIIDAASDDIVDGSVNKFAFLFIELLKTQNKKIYPIDESRLNVADNKLAYLMKSQHVMGDFFYLDGDWYKLEMDSFIAFFEEDNSPILVRRKGKAYYYLDPYNNSSVLVTGENKNQIRPYAFFVYPSTDSGSILELLWSGIKYCKEELIIYLALILAPFVIGGIFLIVLSMFKKNGVAVRVDNNVWVSVSFALLAITAVFLVNIVVARTNFRFSTRVRACVFPAILKHFFTLKSRDEKRMSRELVTTFISFIDSIETVITSGLNGIQYLIYSVLCIAALSFINYKIEKPFMDMLIVYLCVSFITSFFVYRLALRHHGNQEVLSAVRKEIIDSMDVIKCNAAEERFYRRFAIAYGKYLTCRLKMDFLSSQPILIANAVSGLGMFLMFILIYGHFEQGI